jgi:hypothetical protein
MLIFVPLTKGLMQKIIKKKDKKKNIRYTLSNFKHKGKIE